jgi:ATP adenylyltransferase
MTPGSPEGQGSTRILRVTSRASEQLSWATRHEGPVGLDRAPEPDPSARRDEAPGGGTPGGEAPVRDGTPEVIASAAQSEAFHLADEGGGGQASSAGQDDASHVTQDGGGGRASSAGQDDASHVTQDGGGGRTSSAGQDDASQDGGGGQASSAGQDDEPVVQDGVGEPDQFLRLWTPHRLAYIKGEKPTTDDDDCPFCRVIGLPDEDGLIVARGSQVYAVLNLYPYNPGHLMVCPYRHVADYPDLTPAETAELADFTKRAMTAVRAVSGAHGFNIGMNQGGIAGAGIAAHLHQHVVPRWGGDTNFMPVVGRTKVLPQLLADTRALLAAAWRETSEEAPPN